MRLLAVGGLAASAGFAFTRDLAANDDEAYDAATNEPGQSALLFVDLDGVRRAVALAAIDRVEPVSIDAIHHKGGRLRLSIDGGMIPLAAPRSAERRVGKECVSTCRSRWSTYHEKKKLNQYTKK